MATPIFNRRRFLGGMAAGLASTPLLPRLAGADAGPVPTRLVFIFSPNGTIKNRWVDWPGQPGSVSEAAIDSVELGPILQPLADHRDSMLVLRGVNMESAYDEPKPKDHWPDHMNHLTGRQCLPRADQTGAIAGVSLDQYVAAELSEIYGPTPFESVQLGARVRKPNGYLPPQRIVSARGSDDPLPPQDDPAEVFATLFDGFDLDATQLAQLRAKRGKVFDVVADELRAVECRLGGDDRIKLQRHLDSIEQLEESLDLETGACEPPTHDALDASADTKLPEIIDQQLGNLHAMLSCGLTRVATFQMGNQNIAHGHLGLSEVHHAYSHGNFNGIPENVYTDAQTVIDAFYASKVARFIDMLAATPEGDGTLLDHTLVVWCHEQSTGNGHSRRDMPYVLAGGSQCGIEMGRVINAGGNNEHRDVTTNDLLTTLANAVGVPTETFGDPAHVHGPLDFLL